MDYPNGIKISELTPVGIPNRTDVIILNISDKETRKITYNNLLNNIKLKVESRSDWDETNPNEPDYIKNKPDVYLTNNYIQNLLTIN